MSTIFAYTLLKDTYAARAPQLLYEYHPAQFLGVFCFPLLPVRPLYPTIAEKRIRICHLSGRLLKLKSLDRKMSNPYAVSISVRTFDIPKSREQLHEKLRSEFAKHKNVTDIRVIDMLVIKVNTPLCSNYRYYGKLHKRKYFLFSLNLLRNYFFFKH